MTLQAINSVAYNLVSEQIQGDSFSINCCSAKKEKKKTLKCLVMDKRISRFSRDSVRLRRCKYPHQRVGLFEYME